MAVIYCDLQLSCYRGVSCRLAMFVLMASWQLTPRAVECLPIAGFR